MIYISGDSKRNTSEAVTAVAKAMKAEGIDINTIVKVSGLSVEEIEKL